MRATETTIYCARALAAPRGKPYLVSLTLIGNERADYCQFWPSRADALADARRLKAMARNATVQSELGSLA